MTVNINEAQAKSINDIIEKALADAKLDIEAKIEGITTPTVPVHQFKVGDKVIVSKDAKCLDYRAKPTIGVYFGKQIEAEVVGVDDPRGNVTVDAESKTQFVAPQFLTAAPKFKDGDRVSGTGAGVTRTGELLPKGQSMEYSHERTIKTDGGNCYFVKAASIVAAPRVLKVGNVVEVTKTHNPMWAGQGVVQGAYGTDTTIKMISGPQKGSTGGFVTSRLVFVSDAEPKPAAAWAVGDSVLVDGKAGKITVLQENRCCGDDEVQVTFDGGIYDYDYFGYADIESLDDSRFDRLNRYERPFVGEKLTLAEKYGAATDRVAGQKVTVVSVATSPDYAGQLITVRPASGWDYTAYSHRFARTA